MRKKNANRCVNINDNEGEWRGEGEWVGDYIIYELKGKNRAEDI